MMNESALVFAFALDEENRLKNSHFGDASKYGIYRLEDRELKKEIEVLNHLKDADKHSDHGSGKKGNYIIDFLKKFGVNVLVSLQFGPNIKMVNHHFIPVIVSNHNVEEVIPWLLNYTMLFFNEINNQPNQYRLFRIKDNRI